MGEGVCDGTGFDLLVGSAGGVAHEQIKTPTTVNINILFLISLLASH